MPAHNITDNGGNLAAIKFPHPGCRFAGSLMWTWIIHELTKWIKDVIGGYSHHALRQQEVYGNTALSTQPVTASMMKSVCNSDENLSGFRRSSLACQTVRSAALVSRSRRLNPDFTIYIQRMIAGDLSNPLTFRLSPLWSNFFPPSPSQHDKLSRLSRL